MVDKTKHQVQAELVGLGEESEEEIEDMIGASFGGEDDDLMQFCDQAWHNLAKYWIKKHGS